MNNETATAVTAEAVTAAATQAAASQKIAAKSIAETSTQETTDRSSWLKVITTSVLASLVVALIVLAFTWPTKTMEAKNLPVSIAGPEVTVSQFEQSLKDQGIETFDLKQASSREEAEQQIKQRETYGAIIFTEGAAPEVLTAPAANAAATQMLNGVATQLNAQIQQKALAAKTEALTQAVQTGGEQGAQAAAQLEQMKVQAEQASAMAVKTTVVVPLSENDSSGSGIAISAFPLVTARERHLAPLRHRNPVLRHRWCTDRPDSERLVRHHPRRLRNPVGCVRRYLPGDRLLHCGCGCTVFAADWSRSRRGHHHVHW